MMAEVEALQAEKNTSPRGGSEGWIRGGLGVDQGGSGVDQSHVIVSNLRETLINIE